MKYPLVRYGQTNKAVLALQNGLKRALKARGLDPQNSRNKTFGSYTKKDLLKFRRGVMKQKGPISGRYAGAEVWKALQPWLGDYDRKLIRQYNRAVVAAKARRAAERAEKIRNSESAKRFRLRAIALEFYAKRAEYRYQQYRPMPWDLFAPVSRWRLDCSSSVTLIYKKANLPDPNGRNYDGQGYTGTLVQHGRRVNYGGIGDLNFYGDQGGGVPKHVTITVSSSMCVSFGSTPIRLTGIGYRGDVERAHAYV